MNALSTSDERARVLVHSVRERLVDRVLPALGQPASGDPRPAGVVSAEDVAAARTDLTGAVALLGDALAALGGER